MWTPHVEPSSDGTAPRVSIRLGASCVTCADALRDWRSTAEFRSFFTRTLASSPFAAFRWETPPVTVATAHRPFEFVLIDAPELAQAPDVSAFRDQIARNAKQGDAVFQNLGGDATLVVPAPIAEPAAYAHIGAFVRAAPDAQQHALWAAVGEAMQSRLDARPVWLSTAGA